MSPLKVLNMSTSRCRDHIQPALQGVGRPFSCLRAIMAPVQGGGGGHRVSEAHSHLQLGQMLIALLGIDALFPLVLFRTQWHGNPVIRAIYI